MQAGDEADTMGQTTVQIGGPSVCEARDAVFNADVNEAENIRTEEQGK